MRSEDKIVICVSQTSMLSPTPPLTKAVSSAGVCGCCWLEESSKGVEDEGEEDDPTVIFVI